MMLAPEPPGLPPLEAMYMDEQLRFYEQDNGKPNMAYCDLQPIGFEHGDHMPPSTPQDIIPSNQRQFTFEDIADLDSDRPWQFKSPDQWQPCDVIDWIFHWAAQNRVDLLDINTLSFNNITGSDICRMSRNEFCTIDSKYGNALYESFQYLLAQYRTLQDQSDLSQQPMVPAEHDIIDDVEWNRDRCSRWNSMYIDAQGPSPYSGCDSDRESASSSMSTVNERPDLGVMFAHPAKMLSKPSPTALCVKKVGRRGRPPKKDGKLRRKGSGKLWEFIRDLLLNPATNPSMIRWERREDGIFKFVQSDKVARLWGDRKQNPRMTYEKLSRAMRYYYKSQVLLPVFGRRLVYKFGPNATGWRPIIQQPQM